MRKLVPIIFLLTLLSGCIETDLQEPLEETLRIKNPEETIRATGSYQFDVEFSNMDGVIEEVVPTWTSSNPSILSFNGQIATAHATGEVEITATAEGIETTSSVSISASQESVMITMFVEQLSIDDTFQFGINYLNLDGLNTSANASWSSSDPSIATVTTDGLVTGISEGQVTIQVLAGLVSDDITLTVVEGVVVVDPEIRFTQFDDELFVGNNFQFEAKYFGTDGKEDETQTIAWASNNPSVLSVDGTGLASALDDGMATLTASANGLMATFDVDVIDGDVVRTGSLQGVGGYDITGNFSLEWNESQELILTVTNYQPDGPGPYFYLTNSTTNVANSLNLGAAPSSGDYTINVTQVASMEGQEVSIYTYSVLMVWCEPFGVRLGYGEFDN